MNTSSDIALRVGAFLFIALLGWFVLPSFFFPLGMLVISPLTTLIAGLAANIACSHSFESGKFEDFSLGWNGNSLRNLAWGVLLGGGAIALMTLAVIATGAAEFAQTKSSATASALPLFLFLGALGEELLFHGYLFQYLTRITNPAAVIASVGILFGLAHLLSNDATPIGALNTALWGGVLGLAWWRARSLWLPVGIHFGWNLALALLGEPLSGIRMGATEFGLVWHASELWSGGSYGPEAGLPATGLAGVLFWVLRRRR